MITADEIRRRSIGLVDSDPADRNAFDAEVQIVRRVVAAIEDRPAFCGGATADSADVVLRSVEQMRDVIRAERQGSGLSDQLVDALVAVQATCQKFLVQARQSRGVGVHPSWAFNLAVGEMRGVVGVHLVRLAYRYGLDVEDGLAQILPIEPERFA
jgi:hypothetical protein